MQFSLFDNKIYNRYLTLISNIKSKSNSFYDSYLDLLEETIKYILDNNKIEYNKAKTCGMILKEESVEKFFLNTLSLESFVFEKFFDYIKKCNDHKHKKEKTLSIESVINYLSIYFDLVNCYKKYLNEEEIKYDKEYYISIFGEIEKLNNQYKEELIKLQEELKEIINEKELSQSELDEYKSLLSIREIEKVDLEKQNNILLMQINYLNKFKENHIIIDKINNIEKQQEEILAQNDELKASINNISNKLINKNLSAHDNKRSLINFLCRANMEYVYFDNDETFKRKKKLILILGLVLILIGVINTIISYNQIGYYTTYIFFENLFMFLAFIMLMKNIKLKRIMNDIDLVKCSMYKYKFTEICHYEPTYRKKRRCTILYVLTIISVVLEIICVFTEYKSVFIILGIVFQIAFMVIAIIFYIKNSSLYELFEIFVRYKGLNEQKEPITIWYMYLEQKFYSDKEFKEKYKKVYVD